MSRFQEWRMIDILSNIDMSLLEGEFPEMDLSNEDILGMYSDKAFTEELGLRPVNTSKEALTELSDQELAQYRKKKVKKRLALLSGIAAGSIAVTGVIVFVCKKYELLKKAA